MAFVPLHNHSDYSLLDGASQLPAMVERAVELGMPALALTDHGVMYGAIELLKLCTKAGIKPIIGNEMYVINGSIDDPQPKKERRYHLVVLAKNATGYRNLVKLTSISHLRGMRGRGIFARACIDKALGIGTTGVLAGAFEQQVDIQRRPVDGFRAGLTQHLHAVAVDMQAIAVDLHLTGETPVGGVETRQVFNAGLVGQVIQRDDFQLCPGAPLMQRTQHAAADTAITVEGNSIGALGHGGLDREP